MIAERKYRFRDSSRAPSIRRMSRLLTARMGTPEGYGSVFSPEGECWGHTWIDRFKSREMVSMDNVKNRAGVTRTLVTVRRHRKGGGA
jgi:hypothetical protein